MVHQLMECGAPVPSGLTRRSPQKKPPPRQTGPGPEVGVEQKMRFKQQSLGIDAQQTLK
jgi:hypothetical protein